ncbi:probable WRKY transcription factor 4 [Malania oleifera]|uniref:probable WRKY transcription factor 4 n=1 Tax=Malania oleifera TaxID=397392 RepID=UPI0025AE5BD2|nr:probable WRKY transcription factor 4 [Malania oleifera]
MADETPTSPPPPPPHNDQTAPITASASPPSPSRAAAEPRAASLSALSALGSETLPSIGTDRDFECPSFSELLEGVMAVNPADFRMGSEDRTPGNAGIEGKFGMTHQEVLAGVTAKAAQNQSQLELQTPCKLSPATQSELSVPNSTPARQEPFSAPQEGPHMQEMDQRKSSNHKTKHSHVILKTPGSDGFNWRKYGQKQVKSSETSRSYYRCTHSNCHAKKKVQSCDHTGRVIEIIYKGGHNHDPPQKIRCSRPRKVSSAGPGVGSDTVDCPLEKLDSAELSMFQTRRETGQTSLPTPALEGPESQDSGNSDGLVGIKVEECDDAPETKQRIESEQSMLLAPEQRGRRLSSSNEITGFETDEEYGDDPAPKRRMKDKGVGYSVPLFRTVKEPKVVVHAAGDVGVSSDGYRWRKYGQKKVKGNPYPRSYYRCTSAGCPVRKHVERAAEDTAAIIITYEGKHDHDMPVPKKRHGPPNSALIAAAAAMNNAQCKKTETNRTSSTHSSVDVEGDLTGEKALELGGEQALESARTLLSIGIELKPC